MEEGKSGRSDTRTLEAVDTESDDGRSCLLSFSGRKRRCVAKREEVATPSESETECGDEGRVRERPGGGLVDEGEDGVVRVKRRRVLWSESETSDSEEEDVEWEVSSDSEEEDVEWEDVWRHGQTRGTGVGQVYADVYGLFSDLEKVEREREKALVEKVERCRRELDGECSELGEVDEELSDCPLGDETDGSLGEAVCPFAEGCIGHL